MGPQSEIWRRVCAVMPPSGTHELRKAGLSGQNGANGAMRADFKWATIGPVVKFLFVYIASLFVQVFVVTRSLSPCCSSIAASRGRRAGRLAETILRVVQLWALPNLQFARPNVRCQARGSGGQVGRFPGFSSALAA